CLDLVRALEAGECYGPASGTAATSATGAGNGNGTPVGDIPVTRAETPAEGVLQIRFGTVLAAGQIRQRLEGFREHWKGLVVRDDGENFVFQMKTPRSFWQRWTGRQPALEVHIRLGCPPPRVQAPTDVRVDIQPRDCGREQSDELLKVVG